MTEKSQKQKFPIQKKVSDFFEKIFELNLSHTFFRPPQILGIYFIIAETLYFDK
jgi:hypothetical protein